MPVGRPRTFDTEKALEKAMKVFWRRGYEGATLPELTKAMGINRPSMYAAFGNKESLFRKVMEKYASGPGAQMCAALQLTTARAVAEAMLHASTELLGNTKNPKGCLGIQGALACGDSADGVRKDLANRRRAQEAALRERFERAQAEGDLTARANAADLARYICTVMQGMSVQASGGTGREELETVARMAMRVWPESGLYPARRAAPHVPPVPGGS